MSKSELPGEIKIITMGLLSGIYIKEGAGHKNLRNIIADLLRAQRHRDMSEPEVFLGDYFAFGMVNKHDSIFCYDGKGADLDSPPGTGQSGIAAFVDGVVLDVPKHRQYFEKNGFSIPVPTCSAIVAAAYQKWGLDFMMHLEGEFSCAVWESKNNILALARDPYGHKPLHYYYDGKRLLFSSEIKGVLAGGVNPEIDLTGLSDFLSLNCIPYPATIFKNIFQVPPGGIVIVDNNGMKTKTYWEPTISIGPDITLEDAVEQSSDALRDAVKKRMVTDEAYCFLSGGIDSSAVISFASEIAGKTVHAISVGFGEEEENELDDASVMAKHVEAEHHQIIATPDSFFDMLDTMVYHHDSPFTDTSAYPTFYAAKLAREFTDIILTGDGPDQTMGGSDHHVFAVKHNLFSDRNKAIQSLYKVGSKFASLFSGDPSPSIFSKIERKLYRDSVSPVHAAYDLRSYFPDIVKKYICSDAMWEIHEKNNPFRHPESWFREAKGLDSINRYLYADIRFYVPDDLMIKVDRMCMAHGLETLSPFQDIDLAKIVNSLPGHYKVNQSKNNEVTTKYILKQVCKSRFPEQILNKKKKGFAIPLDKWLRQDQGKFIREILLDPCTLNRGYFRKKSVEKLVDVFLQGKGDYFFPSPNAIVGLLTLELWHRRYLE